MTLTEAIETKQALKEQGPWFPACGGTEKPFKVGFYRYQYMFQPSTRNHAYLNLDTDMFLTDEDADSLMR